MILGMGPLELGIILIVVLIIFGPKNLPKLGKSLGKTVKGIREGMEEGESEAKGEVAEATEAEEVIVNHEPDDDSDAEPASEASEDVRFCGSCGASNPSENKFCKKCGAKLD